MSNAIDPSAVSNVPYEDGWGFGPYLVEGYLSGEILAVMAPENLFILVSDCSEYQATHNIPGNGVSFCDKAVLPETDPKAGEGEFDCVVPTLRI